MATFRVGMRVRQIYVPTPKADGRTNPYGCRVGDEGVVRGFRSGKEASMCVRMDRIGRDLWTCPQWYEPILDQKHEACDEDFKRDLDRLLERQGVAA